MPSKAPSGRVHFILGVVLLWSLSGPAQNLQGRFYPEKDSYMLGEPVLFNLEIRNAGSEVVYINAANPAKCLDTYDFFVSGPGLGCGAQWDDHCGVEQSSLAPGDSIHGQWPLDSWYQFEREGKYNVSATRHMPIRTNRGDFQDFTFASKFEVKVDPPDPIRVQSILQEFERNLHSGDPDVRHAALDVLSTAPSYFQSVALKLARDDDAFVVIHAAAALGRMNTPETRAALADIITTGEATTEYKIIARYRAIEALGRSGDASYQGLLEHYIDDKNQHIQLAAMISVAELGKAQAVPQVERFLFSADPVVRKNAAWALRFSMTPEAVEPLISVLSDKNADVRERALTSLKELTGHSAGDTAEDGAPPEKTQNSWRTWWRANKDKITLPDHLDFVCHMK